MTVKQLRLLLTKVNGDLEVCVDVDGAVGDLAQRLVATGRVDKSNEDKNKQVFLLVRNEEKQDAN